MKIKGITLVWKSLCKKLEIEGITLFPFIILKEKRYKQRPILMNHERIHLMQQIEMLIIPFYVVYIGEYMKGRLKGLPHWEAYRNISFEKEAYACERDLYYLQHRPPFASWRYL